MATTEPGRFVDDVGDGKYDYIPVAERVPLHAEKAKEFLIKGDLFNALSHAKTCSSLAAQGYLKSPAYGLAQAVLAELRVA